MGLVDQLIAAAAQKGLIDPASQIGLAEAFCLVRDMPYQRASNRQPETLIHEWRGTCSGKHYLLQALFAELGCPAQVMACTCAQKIEKEKLPPEMHNLWQAAEGRYVDVHNYLLAETIQGPMIVDATWPLATRQLGLISNQDFIPGKDQQLACHALQSWEVPPGQDPQVFKDQLLSEHFTPAELAFREAFIMALSAWTTQSSS